MKHGFLLLLAAAAANATAQGSQRPDPVAPAAPAPRIEYRSAFADYRPLGELEAASWRAANDAVTEHGNRQPAKPPPEKEKPRDEHHGEHR